MNASNRVFINTIAQYVRTIINMLLSLYTVRLVLATLGVIDYGVYTLIAGVVAMLSFITNSLVTTTQRFVSFYQGKGILYKQKEVFNNSLIIHIFIGLLVVIILVSITPLLFNGFLNIPEERNVAARLVYKIVVLIIFITFLAAPYRALIISHENIVYISVIEVLDGLLKVIFVTIITLLSYDKLILYGVILLVVQLFNFLVISVYCYIKYDECVYPSIRKVNKGFIKELFTFAGWSLYSTGCFLGRHQGIAIVLNLIAGPIVNAAYGIGSQVAGYTNYLSSSLVNAISPQIIKAEGNGDRQRALWLSNVTSKFIFFLLSAICVPCMFEIDSILNWWLKEVPEKADFFCIMVMIGLLIDSLSIGLMYENQAIGKIGLYTVVLTTPKLLTLPLAWIVLKSGYSIFCVAAIYWTIELLCAIGRLPFMKHIAGLSVKKYFNEVTLLELTPFVICVGVSFVCSQFFNFKYGFVLTFVVSIMLYSVGIYVFGLTIKEKEIIGNVFNSVSNKLSKGSD